MKYLLPSTVPGGSVLQELVQGAVMQNVAIVRRVKLFAELHISTSQKSLADKLSTSPP
jgi:hypothetical protein